MDKRYVEKMVELGTEIRGINDTLNSAIDTIQNENIKNFNPQANTAVSALLCYKATINAFYEDERRKLKEQYEPKKEEVKLKTVFMGIVVLKSYPHIRRVKFDKYEKAQEWIENTARVRPDYGYGTIEKIYVKE